MQEVVLVQDQGVERALARVSRKALCMVKPSQADSIVIIGGGGGMPDLSSLMNDPSIAEM